MKMEIRYAMQKVGILLLLLTFIMGSFFIYNHYEYKKWESERETSQLNYDRDYALAELGVLKGKVQEIRRMYVEYTAKVDSQEEENEEDTSTENTSEENESTENNNENNDSSEVVTEEPDSEEIFYLRCELDAIANYKPPTTNEYLSNLNFSITAKSVDDICEELTLQIGQRINSIRFGKESK